MRNEIQFLIDNGNAGSLRFARALETDRPAIEQNVTVIRRKDARQDTHQGGLARAVLAEQRIQPPALDGDARALQGFYSWERFGNATCFEQRRRRGSRD